MQPDVRREIIQLHISTNCCQICHTEQISWPGKAQDRLPMPCVRCNVSLGFGMSSTNFCRRGKALRFCGHRHNFGIRRSECILTQQRKHHSTSHVPSEWAALNRESHNRTVLETCCVAGCTVFQGGLCSRMGCVSMKTRTQNNRKRSTPGAWYRTRDVTNAADCRPPFGPPFGPFGCQTGRASDVRSSVASQRAKACNPWTIVARLS